ncbi:hypothetical protein Ciccas_007750 [Cichlidogyrus casuarinus]|uniref:Uncharacterized protein n=1 Tax=Cichlidogyrus casuarinus TaxID=1844966 RepID=A0ABD2Q2Q3_9PLAT
MSETVETCEPDSTLNLAETEKTTKSEPLLTENPLAVRCAFSESLFALLRPCVEEIDKSVTQVFNSQEALSAQLASLDKALNNLQSISADSEELHRYLDKLSIAKQKLREDSAIVCGAMTEVASKSVLKFLRGLDISGIELKSDQQSSQSVTNIWPSAEPLSAMGRLQWLKLRNVGLRETELPQQLSQLSQLTHLSLAQNALTSIATLQNWPKRYPDLRVLNLRRNNIASPGAIPRDLFECPNLQVVDVSRNQLKAVPAGLENATGLLVLNLSDNQITQIQADLFVNCHELMLLDLSGNEIAALPAQLRRCYALQKLYLSRNPLRHAQLRSLVALKQLEVLHLADTERSLDNFPADLDRLERLVDLDLSMNQLAKIPEPVLKVRDR